MSSRDAQLWGFNWVALSPRGQCSCGASRGIWRQCRLLSHVSRDHYLGGTIDFAGASVSRAVIRGDTDRTLPNCRRRFAIAGPRASDVNGVGEMRIRERLFFADKPFHQQR
jgi:hypothetical protein